MSINDVSKGVPALSNADNCFVNIDNSFWEIFVLDLLVIVVHYITILIKLRFFSSIPE